MNTSQTIRRAQKDKSHPYKALPRAAFENDNLSFEARGVLGYILVKPDNWQVQIGDLRREGGMGRDKTYRILNELIAAGYCTRIEHRAHGRITGYTYMIDEEPSFLHKDTPAPLPEKAEAADTSPLPDLPYTVLPLPVNQEHTNKEVLPLSKNSTKEEKQLVAAAPQPLPPPAKKAKVPNQGVRERSAPRPRVPPGRAAANPATSAILSAYAEVKERLEPGAIVHFAAEGVAAKQLAANGWTPDQVVECFELMKRENWWREKSLRLASVANQIGAKFNGKRTGAYEPASDKWVQNFTGPVYDLETVEINF